MINQATDLQDAQDLTPKPITECAPCRGGSTEQHRQRRLIQLVRGK
jgi:hypothetical protein